MPLSTVTRAEIELDIARALDRVNPNGTINSKFTDLIALWFALAHRSIQRRRDFYCMQRTSYETIVVSTTAYAQPDDMKTPGLLYAFDATTGKTIHFYDGPTSMTTLRDRRHQSDARFGVNAAYTGRLYAIWNGNVEIDPVPESSIVGKRLQMDYHRWLPLPGQNAFDWFTTNGRDYLMYRALIESIPILGADARADTWKEYAKMAWSELIAHDVDATTGGELVARG